MTQGITRRDGLAGVATALLASIPTGSRAEAVSIGHVALTLQQLVADVEKLGERNAILLPTADLYRISRQLVLGRATGLMGLGPAKSIISYVGDALNPATQDNATGAMITWKGTDHAWGGIKDVALFANRRAIHCLYVEGDITPGFKIVDVHGQHALLDIVSIATAGTSSAPVNLIIQALTAYPFIKDGFSGVSAVCGRSVLRFRLNGSVGSITVRDANLDNGALAFIDIDCSSDLAGIDYLFDNCRFEQNRANGDIVTLRYSDAASEPGTLTFRNCKHAHGAAGACTSAFVRNRTRSNPRRPDIGFDPFLSHEAPCSFRLPPLAHVAPGFRVRFSAQSGHLMTIRASASDTINGVSSLTSRAIRDALTIEKSGLGEWTVLSRVGKWS